ncbi:MAG: alpha/beta fold hydrolase [Alphaproteobacteria bacterium]|nr:alpha/beta fold hydrolase [Alphaproteobacteria bacterium]
MSVLVLGPSRSLYYKYDPSGSGKPTFVFINALTGNVAAWQAELGPALREAGYGTLAWNFRGQANSTYAPEDTLDEATITSDLMALLEELSPQKPILTGLSIGGLYGINAYLRGSKASAMVFMNTLRKPGTHLSWINEAVTRLAKVGGGQLMMDANLPHIAGPAFLEKMRANALPDAPYVGLEESDPIYQLLANARDADWDIAYEKLDLPVLSLTGKCDRVFYNPENVAELMGRMPNATEVVFDDIGHLIPMEDSARTASALIGFAAKL